MAVSIESILQMNYNGVYGKLSITFYHWWQRILNCIIDDTAAGGVPLGICELDEFASDEDLSKKFYY